MLPRETLAWRRSSLESGLCNVVLRGLPNHLP